MNWGLLAEHWWLNSTVRLNGPGSLRAAWVFFIIVPTYISILEGGEKAVWPWVTICVRLALYSLVLGEKKKKSWARIIKLSGSRSAGTRLFLSDLTKPGTRPAHTTCLISTLDLSCLPFPQTGKPWSSALFHSLFPLPSAYPGALLAPDLFPETSRERSKV